MGGNSRYGKFTFGPAGVCDACGRFCQGLHQVGIRCYHCLAGTFIHRGEWIFARCPVCMDGEKSWACEACSGTGVSASRKSVPPQQVSPYR